MLVVSAGTSCERDTPVFEVNSDTVGGEFDILLGTRLRLFGSGGTSHEERADRPSLWHSTITSGLSVQF